MNWPRCGLVSVLCAVAAAQDFDRAALESEGRRHMESGYDLAGQGKRTEAIAEYQQALAIHRSVLGAKHLRTLTTMNLLASARLMSGDLAGAEPLLTEIISTGRELYPRDMQLAEALGGLSCIVARRGNLPEAQVLADEALALSIAIEGEQSVDSAMMYANAAEIHRLAGRDSRALPLYRKARAIYEKQLDPANPRIASVLSQEGLILMDSGQLTLAGQAMTRAVEILRRSCPGCITETWTAESNLALLRMKQEKYAEADRLLSDVLMLQENWLPHPGRETAQTLRMLAAVREKQRRHGDAVRLTQRANQLLASRSSHEIP
jgi:tetratricopeptide (TPR) repeat protein